MIRTILSGMLVLMVSLAMGQVQTQVIGDSVRIRSNTGTGELILENSTKNVNGFLYNKGNGRTEFRKTLDYTVQGLYDSTVIVWNVANGINASVTLGGTGRTLSITNPEPGYTYTIKVAQDGSGGRTIGTWPTNTQWPGGTAPILTAAAGKYDLVSLYYDGTNYFGTYHQNFLSTPPGVSIYSSDTKSNTGSTVHSLTSVPAGALLVLTTAFEGAQSSCTVTSSPALTWTKRADASAANSGDAEIWTAVFSAGGTISITSDWPAVGTEYQSSVCYVVTNQETSLSIASNTATGQSQPSVALTTTRANSIIFCVTSDYSAQDGGTNRTYRDTSTETLYFRNAVAATFYHYYKLAPTVTGYTEGLTAPAAQQSGTAVVEIRGN